MKTFLLCLVNLILFIQIVMADGVSPIWPVKERGIELEASPSFLEMSMTADWNYLPPWYEYGSIYDMCVYDGSLYVVGDFFDAAGIADADNIVRWDGCSWYAVANGLTGTGYEVAVIGDDIYVGGSFLDAGGNLNADNIAVLNGNQWDPVGSGLNGTVFTIAGIENGVYVGGTFSDAGGNPDADRIAKWNGSSWNALGTGLNEVVYTIVIQGNQVFAGGEFTDAGGNSLADYIALWQNNNWQALGGGINDRVWNMAVHDSDVYIIGAFTEAGGNFTSNYIAKWDGSNWQNLGDYFYNNNNSVINTITVADDLIYVGASSGNYAWIMEWNIQNEEWTENPPVYPNGAPIGSIAIDDNYIYVGNIVTWEDDGGGGGGDGGCYGGFTGHHSISRGAGGILRWGEPPPEIIITGVPESLCENDLPISLPTIQSGYPGNWSGPGVINNTFDPDGLSGWNELTFTPLQSPCPGPVVFGISVIQNFVSLDIPNSICESGIPLELNNEQDGVLGNWSGSGVQDNIFYPLGFNGDVPLTFTPYSFECADVITETIQVVEFIIPELSGIPLSVCENENAFSLATTQDGIQGNWSGVGVSNNNFNPSGLNGIVVLTFTPYSGTCAVEATTEIDVNPPVILTISGVPDSLCQFNNPIILPNIQTGVQGNWSGLGVSNNIFNPSGLNGNIILTFTPYAGICALPATVSISVFQNTYSISGIPNSVCVIEPPIPLPQVQNGIMGNWSGFGVLNNTFNPSGQNGNVTLTFTPDAGQCASQALQNIIVNALVIPVITGIPSSLCENSQPIPLLTFQNSFTGYWSGQGVTSNTFSPVGLSGDIILTFTPDAGQCALSNTTIIHIDPVVTPLISGVPTSICENNPDQILPTAQNGISGNWSGPGVSNNTLNPSGQNGIIALIFTPDAGQCAATAQWNITIEDPVILVISDLPSNICQTDIPISLPTTQNGFSGVWSGPGVTNNTFNPFGWDGIVSLFFNPDAGQCADVAVANIMIESAILPSISAIPLSVCENDALVNLPTIQDGIAGSWSGPGVSNNIFNPDGQTGIITLTFIPDAGQCAIQVITTINVSTSLVPIITGVPASLCQSDSTLLLPELQNGITGNWSGQNVTANVFTTAGLEGNYVLAFTPFPGQCALPASTQVTVNTSPHFIHLYAECDSFSQTYNVAFDIIGGDPASYMINGNPVGGSAFISTPIISDSTKYVFTLDDANGCGPVLIEGSINCACATYAGTMNFSGSPLNICDGSDFSVPFNGDSKLDADDLSGFVLHDNAGTQLGTIYAINQTTTFIYPPGIVLGQVYFISPIAGSNDGHGSIDFNDPCLSVSQGIPVIFYHPQVTISSGNIICTDECITYTFQLSGEKPFELAYQVIANGVQTDQLLITDTNKLDIVICPQDFGITDGVVDIIPLHLTDANCTVSLTPFTGSQTLVRRASTAFISETLCQGESLTVNGTVYDQINPSGTQKLQNVGGCDSTISIQLAFYPEAIHELNQILCFGGSLVINGTEYNEAHPQGTEILLGESINGCDSIIDIDLEFDSIVMSNFHTTLCSGESIEINENTYDELHPKGTELYVGGSALGCDSLVNINLSFYPPAASILNPKLCKGDMVVVNGTVYDENHPNGKEILKNASVFGCDSVIEVALKFIPEAYRFIIDTLDAGESITVNGTVYNQTHSHGIEIIAGGSIAGCDSTIEITLYFRKALSALTETIAPVCHGESTGEILVREINGGIPPYEVSVDGGSQMIITDLPVFLSGLNSGKHKVIITDAKSNQLIIEAEIPDRPILEVDAGIDLLVQKGEDAALTAKASFEVSTWLWTPKDFLTCADCPDPLVVKPDHDVTYTIIATDENGCQASDEVLLTIRYEDQSDVYVPNIFSPNGDNINDTWRIYSTDENARLVSLQILDRWGAIIFSRSDKLLNDTSTEWNGGTEDKEMGTGVYVFIAVVEKDDGKIVRLRGDISLLR